MHEFEDIYLIDTNHKIFKAYVSSISLHLACQTSLRPCLINCDDSGGSRSDCCEKRCHRTSALPIDLMDLANQARQTERVV